MQWRIGAAACLAAVLAACGFTELRDRMEACGVRTGPFPAAAKCMEERWPSSSGLNEYGLLYYRYTEAFAEEVNAGRMTDTQARLAHAEMLVAVLQRSTAERRAAIANVLNNYQVLQPAQPVGNRGLTTTCVQMNNVLTCR